MKTESELFWQSVRELAAMRMQIPMERRQMSGVRMLIRDEQAAQVKQRAELKSSKRRRPRSGGRAGVSQAVEWGMSEALPALEIVPPHERPDLLRACFRGTLTQEEAQAKLGASFRVLELRPASVLSDGETRNQHVAATEVIFAPIP